MDKYTQLNRFYHDQILKVYMYAFIYVDPDTMPMRKYFLDTIFFENHNKMSNQGPVQKHFFGFSYMRSECYELYHKFDDT